MANHMETSNGIRLLEANEWGSDEADEVVYTDTCLKAMGFWMPASKQVFKCPMLLGSDRLIFFFEALVVILVLHHVSTHRVTPHRVAIFCNNTNMVDVFSLLHTQPVYNLLFITAANIKIFSNIQLRIFHISGK